MKVGIVNYGMGNLASVSRAVEVIGHEPFIANCPADIQRASRLILPGVGSFAEGIDRLNAGGWAEAIREFVHKERPLLGICLGMQFLADRAYEGGARDGFGFIGGEIVHLSEFGCTDRVPHVGWNEVRFSQEDCLFETIPDESDFYFVHSYGFQVADIRSCLASVEHSCGIPAVVRNGYVWGTQFHPEKSSKVGIRLLRNFLERSEC